MFKITHSTTQRPEFLAVSQFDALMEIDFYNAYSEKDAKAFLQTIGVWKIKYKTFDIVKEIAESVMQKQNQN